MKIALAEWLFTPNDHSAIRATGVQRVASVLDETGAAW